MIVKSKIHNILMTGVPLVILIFIFASLAACGSPTALPELLTPTLPPATLEVVSSPTAEQSPTVTPAPDLAFILYPSSAGETTAQEVLQGWQQADDGAGLHWELRSSLAPADLTPGLRLVIAYPGSITGPELSGLANTVPDVQFLSIGIQNVSPGSNITSTSPLRTDQQGFMAGILAAILTPDWRIGVISTSDSVSGLAARNGFLNGATLFCGLCNPYHGPIVDYPLYIELPSTASSAEWQAAAQALLDKSVETIFLGPGVMDSAMLNLLAQNNVQLIGSSPMPAGFEKQWVTSILPSDTTPYLLLPDLLNRKSAGEITLSLDFFETQDVLTPGKEHLARQYLADLMSGYLDTGVDPTTGDIR